MLSRHPDPGPVSQVVPRCTPSLFGLQSIVSVIIIIIVAFGPYWNIGRLQVLSGHPDPKPVSQAVPRCTPFSLFVPPDHGTRCFLGCLTLSLPAGSKSSLDVYCQSFAFGGCVQSISSVFGGFCLLLVAGW